MPSVKYPQLSTFSPVPSAQCPQSSVLSAVPSVQYPQSNAISPVPSVQYPSVQCPQSSALSPVPSVQHPEPSCHHTCREKKKLPLQARILRKNGQSFALKKSPNSLAVGPGPHPTWGKKKFFLRWGGTPSQPIQTVRTVFSGRTPTRSP